MSWASGEAVLGWHPVAAQQLGIATLIVFTPFVEWCPAGFNCYNRKKNPFSVHYFYTTSLLDEQGFAKRSGAGFYRSVVHTFRE